MAEKSRSELEIAIKAKDEASATFSKVQANAKEAMAKITGPSTLNRQMMTSGRVRGSEEQATRNAEAQRLREIRANTRRAAAEAAAEERLFGQSVSAEIRRSHQVITREAASGGRQIVNARRQVTGELDRLKNVLGGRGSLKEGFEILMGGGAIAGLAFAARALKDVTRAAAELGDELRAGNITFGQFAERGSQQLPILGSIRQAGLSIREMATSFLNLAPHGRQFAKFFDDGTIALREQKQELDAIDQRIKQITDTREGFKQFFEGFLDRGALLQAVSESDQIRVQAEIQFRKDLESIQKQQEEIEGLASGIEVKDATDASGVAVKRVEVPAAVEDSVRKELETRMKALNEAVAIAQRQRGVDRDRADEVDRKADQDREKTYRDHLLNIADLEGSGQRRIAEIRSQARQEAFQSEGRELDTQIERIEESTRREIETVGDEFAKLFRDDWFRGDSQLTQRFMDIQAKTQAAIAERSQAQIQEARRKDAENQRTKSNELVGSRLEALQSESNLVNEAAKKELDRLKVAEQLRQEQEKLLQTLKDQSLTIEQRAEAELQLSNLPERARRQIELIDRRGQDPIGIRTTTAPLTGTGRFEFGLQGSANSTLEREQLQVQRDSQRVQAEARALLAQILLVLQNPPATDDTATF